jgi:homoserine kinase type II
MAYYTNIDLIEANKILALYDLPKAKSLTPIKQGISNSNFIATLEDDNEIILKISNDKDDSQLLGEQHILLNLRTLGFYFSPAPLLTKNNEPFYYLSPWCGVLFPKLKGKVPVPAPNVCYEIGATLGKLHQLAQEEKCQGLKYPVRDVSKVSYLLHDIQHFTNSSLCPEDFKEVFHQVLPETSLTFINSIFPTLTRSILHGDLYFDNTLFQDDALTAILDFEQAGMGPCLFDIGVSISGSCLQDGKLNHDLTKNFVQGYVSQRALEGNEKKILYHMVLIGFLSISLWRIHRFFLGDLSDSKKMSYQELLQYARVAAKDFSPQWFEKILSASH